MESFNKELGKLLRDVDIFKSSETEDTDGSSSNSQLIEELKNYSNIVAGFRKKSLIGKETLRLKVT